MYYPVGVRKEYEELPRGSNIAGAIKACEYYMRSSLVFESSGKNMSTFGKIRNLLIFIGSNKISPKKALRRIRGY